MKREAILLVALASACLALAAPGLLAADVPGPVPITPDPNKPVPVVVDPMDFRQPIPDPEQGLFEKYDGKLVIFSGVVARSTIDKKAAKHRAELHFHIVKKFKVKGQEVTETEKIAVGVTFRNEETTLQQLFEKEQRARGPGVHLTVQGIGHIMLPDGSLSITDAVIVPGKRNPFSNN
jgi:hypothetical protein